MTKNAIIKTAASTILVVCLTMGTGFNTYASSISDDVESDNSINAINEIIQNFEENINLNENGFYEVELTAVREDFADMNPADLNEAFRQTGMNSTNEIVSTFMSGVESVNSQIADGDLVFVDNENLIDAEDDNYYLQGGSTYDITHWWGRSRYKSTYYANKWANDLNKCAAANAGAAVVAGWVFGGVGAVPNGIASAYCWFLASDVSYYNSLSSRGIVADITWVFAYKMRTQ
jgi:hypothetical protein